MPKKRTKQFKKLKWISSLRFRLPKKLLSMLRTFRKRLRATLMSLSRTLSNYNKIRKTRRASLKDIDLLKFHHLLSLMVKKIS